MHRQKFSFALLIGSALISAHSYAMNTAAATAGNAAANTTSKPTIPPLNLTKLFGYSSSDAGPYEPSDDPYSETSRTSRDSLSAHESVKAAVSTIATTATTKSSQDQTPNTTTPPK